MGRPSNTDAVILALFAKLPRAGTVWPHAERKRWLDAVAATLNFLYPPHLEEEAESGE